MRNRTIVVHKRGRCQVWVYRINVATNLKSATLDDNQHFQIAITSCNISINTIIFPEWHFVFSIWPKCYGDAVKTVLNKWTHKQLIFSEYNSDTDTDITYVTPDMFYGNLPVLFDTSNLAFKITNFHYIRRVTRWLPRWSFIPNYSPFSLFYICILRSFVSLTLCAQKKPLLRQYSAFPPAIYTTRILWQHGIWCNVLTYIILPHLNSHCNWNELKRFILLLSSVLVTWWKVISFMILLHSCNLEHFWVPFTFISEFFVRRMQSSGTLIFG